MTTDGCLQRSGSKTASVQEQVDKIVADLATPPAQEKTAGAIVYLMEELGDARLRCEELIRYTAAATQLIEKSAHRDHFFEIAGNLIEGIPTSVFKLHKALQAVTLAATRIDYEELKQDLRPEKVQQLEEALKDVRIRQVQRRSDPVTQWEQNMIDDWKTAEARNANTEEKESRFEEGKPADPTENMSPEDAATWKEEHAKNKDNFKSAAVLSDDIALELEGAAMALRAASKGQQVKNNIVTSVRMIAQGLGLMQEERASEALMRACDIMHASGMWDVTQKRQGNDEKESRFEEGKPADPTENMSPEDAKTWKEEHAKNKDNFKAAAVKTKADFDKLQNEMRAHLDTFDLAWSRFEKEPEKNKAKLDDAMRYMKALRDVADVLIRNMEMVKSSKTASGDEKESRYEEGKPADPTENMSPEDAKTWKLEHLKNKDNFKEAKRDTHLEGKKGHTLCGERTYDDTLVESVKDTTCHYCKQAWEKQHQKSASKPWEAAELKEMEDLLKKSGYDPKDAKKLQADGMGPYELEHRIKTTKPGAMGSLEFTHNLKKKSAALEWKAETAR